ncbi:MAG TPA: phenylalanine--tRNA ligase subunit beta [Acidimicrobiales bacterium]
MKVLLSWLREFAPLEGDPVALGETMSDLGMAVEQLDRIGEGLDGIVVAKVLQTRPHPNADKVQLVDVDRGDGEALQIVCGAFNMQAGDLVPLATLGTTMPNGMEIGRRKMRGEWSNGMLCSARELGIGDDHAGIWILPGDLPLGAPITEALGIEQDVLYDLEINPNRPDAMSVAGVARDVAARLGVPFSLPDVSAAGAAEVEAERLPNVTVEILDPDLCGRFAARVLRNVQVGPSDPAMARRLALMGMRSINNVVDVSNYVMLELGQPNHAYDLSRVAGPGFRVRRATPGETLVTLDDVTRTFTGDDLLICDAEDRPIGIAGVMGGANTEIDDSTTEVLLEMAWFLPIAVAKTSRRLKLRSEASARFDKGTDPEVIDLAFRRFAQLLGAPLEKGTVDARGELPDRSPVRVRPARVNRLLGSDLSAAEMTDLLAPIGFAAERTGDDLDVTIPPWRYDSATEIDVVEEIARLYGYSRLGRTVPTSPRTGRLTPRQQRRRRLRSLLAGLGLSEAMPLPFLAPGELERCGLPGDGIALLNPLVAEESILRTSLLPGLVGALATNAARRNTGVRLFEIGHVFRRPAGEGADRAELPDEREHLAVALGGQDATAAVQVWRAIAEGLGVTDLRLANAEVPGLHPTRSAVIGDGLGVVGEVDPASLEAHGIGERVGWLEVDLDRLLELADDEPQYRPISRYPSSDIDLAFEVDESVSAADVEATLREAAGDRLAWVKLFDVYRGTGIADGRRSLAYTLRLEALDHTLTDDELQAIRQACIDAVESAHAAALRG